MRERDKNNLEDFKTYIFQRDIPDSFFVFSDSIFNKVAYKGSGIYISDNNDFKKYDFNNFDEFNKRNLFTINDDIGLLPTDSIPVNPIPVHSGLCRYWINDSFAVFMDEAFKFVSLKHLYRTKKDITLRGYDIPFVDFYVAKNGDTTGLAVAKNDLIEQFKYIRQPVSFSSVQLDNKKVDVLITAYIPIHNGEDVISQKHFFICKDIFGYKKLYYISNTPKGNYSISESSDFNLINDTLTVVLFKEKEKGKKYAFGKFVLKNGQFEFQNYYSSELPKDYLLKSGLNYNFSNSMFFGGSLFVYNSFPVVFDYVHDRMIKLEFDSKAIIDTLLKSRVRYYTISMVHQGNTLSLIYLYDKKYYLQKFDLQTGKSLISRQFLMDLGKETLPYFVLYNDRIYLYNELKSAFNILELKGTNQKF
jgi:hypothetical protein